eukprot:symbB.v1.2.010508.t1/scaffold690.1/size332707/6
MCHQTWHKVYVLTKPNGVSTDLSVETLLHEGEQQTSEHSDDADSSDSDSLLPQETNENDLGTDMGHADNSTISRKPRKKRPSVSQIGWLNNLLGELTNDVEHSNDEEAAGDGVESTAGNTSVIARATDIVREAFDVHSPSALQTMNENLEKDEETYLKNINDEAGLGIMEDRENKLITKAVDEFVKRKTMVKPDSPLLEQNISVAIAEQVARGYTEEEAAEEAILNHNSFMGNEETIQTDVTCGDIGDMGVVLQPEAASPVLVNSFEGPFANWMEESSLSLQALYGAHLALQEKTTGQDGELSLVLGNIDGMKETSDKSDISSRASSSKDIDRVENQTVFWVHWKFAGELGRPASLDNSDRVKCIVATGRLKELRNYTTAKILHPAIGVRMERTRGYAGQSRPQVPPHVMRLFAIWKEALARRHDFGNTCDVAAYTAAVCTDCPCFVCGSTASFLSGPGGEGGVAEPQSDRDVVKSCPLCLLWSHSRCNESVAQHGVDQHFNQDETFLLRLAGRNMLSSNVGQSMESQTVGNLQELACQLIRDVCGDSVRSKLGFIRPIESPMIYECVLECNVT